jgi:hypothetical protein
MSNQGGHPAQLDGEAKAISKQIKNRLQGLKPIIYFDPVSRMFIVIINLHNLNPSLIRPLLSGPGSIVLSHGDSPFNNKRSKSSPSSPRFEKKENPPINPINPRRTGREDLLYVPLI